MEPYAALFLTVGIALLWLSWLLLMITSANEDFSWGLCTLFLPPVSYLYALARLDKARDSITLAVGGWLLIWLALAT
ncbi:MAG TPA: hypothetical protein DIW43_16315 [Spongiibacteraceae bacterium]|nr:hypothetical protein [Spongiibacteraceae bacterium]HCS29022.1 hypothetical protein [Spongiibacteraceae bacterium]|tara:strand:+ start:1211 stop:1441 length:231 start_codon:yes stop_codon:yes gene_type:complete